MEKKAFRIGTRGSPLALAQANMVAAAIGGDAELVIVRTAGDREQTRPLAAIGGKGVWTAELERQLLSGEIDMAVHSMKDVESERPGGLFISAMLPRADVRDRLIGLPGLEALTPGATVGTSSPRRAAQLLRRVPGLNIVPFRGNVATRLQRVADGEANATLLAAAGLTRLGEPDVGVAIEVSDMLPAPGQGAVGIEVRADRADLRERLALISHADTYEAVTAERAFARALGGSCHSPVAALAHIEDDRLILRGEILSEDGQVQRAGEASLSGARSRREVETMGATLGERLLSGAPEVLTSLFTGDE